MTLEVIQRQLASHIRNPAEEKGPAGIEARRLKIYRDLFYKNIENFISSGFPILRSLYQDETWHRMVRDFMVVHHCQSPLFLEIGQEFLTYLQNHRQLNVDDPPFIQELAHYEWVELALDIDEQDISSIETDSDGDLLNDLPLVSPLAWSLAYQYPVHKIGVDFQPAQPEEAPCYLIVYRNRDDEVGFMEANSVTARMLELLSQREAASGRQVLEQIADELNHPAPDQVVTGGLEIMQQLQSLDIIVGVKASSPAVS